MKAGDIVTWRPAAKKPKPGFEPLGVTGCKVLELGHTSEDGQPAAIIEAMGQRLPVLVADLTKE